MFNDNKEIDKHIRTEEKLKKANQELKAMNQQLMKSEERLRLVFEHSSNIYYTHTAKHEFVYFSPQVEALLGYTQEEILINRTRLTTDNPINKAGYQHTMKAIETGLVQPPYELELLRKDGKKIWVEVREAPIVEKGEVRYVTGSLIDITNQKKSELIQKTLFNISSAVNNTEDLDELFERIHQLLGEIVNATNIYIALYDEKKQKIHFTYYVSQYEIRPEPVDAQQSKGLTQYVLNNGEAILVSREEMNEMAEKGLIGISGKLPELWLGVPLKTGKTIIGVLSVQSFDKSTQYTTEDKELLTFVSEGIAHAIKHKQSEEQIKKSLKEKEILLRELYHRTKNNMQVIASMLMMQAQTADDENLKRANQDIVDKIHSMSFVHQKLYQAQDLSQIALNEYIRDFSNHLLSTYRLSKENLYFDLELSEVNVSIDSAIPLGLVITELVTNAFKHAFPGKTEGRISIKLYRDKFHKIVIELADNGVGIPDGLNLRELDSMGMKTVFAIVEYQLQGSVSYETVAGLKWQISFDDVLISDMV